MAFAVFLATALVALFLGRWLLACIKFRRVELAFDGEPSLFILGNTLHFIGATGDNVFDLILRLWGSRTQITRMSLLGHLILIASDPDDIEKVVKGKDTQDKSRMMYQFIEYISKYNLVTLNGNEWKAHRKAMTPAFHNELLNKYQEVFDLQAKSFVARVRPGEAEDLMVNLKTSTIWSFIGTAITTDITADAELLFPVLMEVLEAFPPSVTYRSFQPWLWSDTLFGVTSAGRRIRGLVAEAQWWVSEQLAKYRSTVADDDREDFVKGRPTVAEILHKCSGSALPDRHIIDEVTILAGAAIETSAASLGWTFKTLSLRHDVQDRILQEANEVIWEAGAVLAEHLPRLEYTERVLKESLRLTPAVAMFGRSNSHAPTTFDGKHVPKGSTFVINAFGAHRDPRHWEEPLKFDPDRWLPERSQGRHPYAYLPFSTGPRNCIGSRYAMAFMKTLLATVILKYRVDPVDDGHTDPANFPMSCDIATRMPGGVHVVLRPRQPEGLLQTPWRKGR
ncbi:hypothetical protein ONE63_007941 [Megalurothrips usitatus]|uniref:Uncharacterized protein n=1 Tax=Megalurothrips usitatus TaxID=439358 RepID=A0AAV7XTC9_9NEOP|nr:hypothetical protein ONE63_007941 [Megalurothrips usitatus]